MLRKIVFLMTISLMLFSVGKCENNKIPPNVNVTTDVNEKKDDDLKPNYELQLGGLYLSDNDNTWICIYDESNAYFHRFGVSDISTATYEVIDNTLTLKIISGEIYIFTIFDEYLLYESEKATTWTLEKGTKFTFKRDTNIQITQIEPGKYITEDGSSWLTITEDKFYFNRHIMTSYDPDGIYTIKNNKLILVDKAGKTYTFIIEDNYLLFESGEMAEQFVKKGTKFTLKVEETFLPKLGKYVTKDKMAWVILRENNEFVFNIHISTNYVPCGTYEVRENRLILKIGENEECIFVIKDGYLLFESGENAEPLVKKCTRFSLTTDPNNDKSQNDYRYLFVGDHHYINEDTFIIIDSLEKLNDYNDAGYEILGDYDEDFFLKEDLIIVNLFTCSSEKDWRLIGVSQDDDGLVLIDVGVKSPGKNGCHDTDFLAISFLVTVPKYVGTRNIGVLIINESFLGEYHSAYYDCEILEVLVPFSRDGGRTYTLKNNYLEEFDICNEYYSYGYIFFYAYTVEELKEKIEEYKTPRAGMYYYPSENFLNSLIEKYNEDFFKEHILLFYYKYEPNISNNYVHSVVKKGNTLTLNVNRFEGMCTALSSWSEVVAIKKSDIAGVNEININIRTIAELQKHFYMYIKEEHLRYFYINGVSMEMFEGIENLKDVTLFTWNLTVDLVFEEKITEDGLKEIIEKLEMNPKVSHLGYKGRDFIRVIIKGKYYDEVMEKTLSIKTLLSETDIDKYQISLKFRDFTPIGYITFHLKNLGRQNALELEKRIKERNYPFLKDEKTHLHY